MTLYCDASVVNDIRIITGFQEVSTCNYQTFGASSAACPFKGDAGIGYDTKYSDVSFPSNDAANFGFVCLGAFLVVFMYYLITFGEARNWWDPIKSRMPEMPSWLGGGGARGSYGVSSSSSYKSVSSSTGASAPIAASAYGTS